MDPLQIIAIIIALIIILVLLALSIKIVNQWERVVVVVPGKICGDTGTRTDHHYTLPQYDPVHHRHEGDHDLV